MSGRGLLFRRAEVGRWDHSSPYWAFDIFRPQLFTPEGQRSRRVAARFYVIGAPVMVLALWALSAW